MKPKIIAFFLPQFHEIPENNKWHGKGFTEWTNVKKAKPLFKGHQQPRIPYDYYNLLDKNTRKNIGEMAKNYGIYGFCYYHYRFEGKMLLEKPLELFLEDGYPDINFCFSWANHTRQRSRGKGWNKKIEILQKQTYGDKEDREKHFYYLLKFFKNERYIKIDNKPLFLIYNLIDIQNCDEMIQYRNALAKENGFEGIMIMETNPIHGKKVSNESNGIVQFEPSFSFKLENWPWYLLIKLGFKMIYNRYIAPITKLYFHCIFNYDKLCKISLKLEDNGNLGKIFYGGFAQRDNSPRKGHYGYIVVGSTPHKFGMYLKKLQTKSIQAGAEFMFINARNEWAEGCYLEPDKDNGDKYLEQIKNL